jgi:hypothetical protein
MAGSEIDKRHTCEQETPRLEARFRPHSGEMDLRLLADTTIRPEDGVKKRIEARSLAG